MTVPQDAATSTSPVPAPPAATEPLAVKAETDPVSATLVDAPAMEQRPTVVNDPRPQIVSAARGPFPGLEMFSVSPRRSNTMHGTGQHFRAPPGPPPMAADRRRPTRPENPFLSPSRSRVSQNITRRLADVCPSSSVRYNGQRGQLNFISDHRWDWLHLGLVDFGPNYFVECGTSCSLQGYIL